MNEIFKCQAHLNRCSYDISTYHPHALHESPGCALTVQTRSAIEDKNTMLTENVARLKDDLRSADSRRTALEQEARQLQSEVSDAHRRLSVAEASLEVANRVSGVGGFM